MAILSIFKEADFLKTTLLIPERNLFRILFLKEYNLENFEVSDLLYSIKKQTGLNYKDLDVISPLETSQMSIKEAVFPFKDAQKVKKAVKFFSLENFHFKKENLIVSPLKQNAKGSTKSCLYATSKQYITSHVQLYEKLDLPIDSITCIPASLSAFVNNFCNTTTPIFVINVGFDQLNMVLVTNNLASSCFSYSIGLKDFIDVLIDNDFPCNKIDADFIQEIIESLVSNENENHPLKRCTIILKQTIERFIDSCLKKEKLKKPIELLFTGYGFIIEKIFCMNNYCIAPETTKPHIEYDAFTLKRYAIELGSALQLTKFSNQQLLFPLSSNAGKKDQIKMKKNIKISTLSVLALFGLLFTFSSISLSKQKKQLTKGIQTLAKKLQIKELMQPSHSLSKSVYALNQNYKKKRYQRLKNAKAPTLAKVLQSLHQIQTPLKIQNFSYKKEHEQLKISFKADEIQTKAEEIIKAIKENYKKNLLTLDKDNGTIHYTLKY